MRLSDFDYAYPEGLVATHPLPERSSSRMMVLHRQSQSIEHRKFADIPDYFKEGDILVLNDSRVFPCRLVGKRSTGGRAEFFLVQAQSQGLWQALVSPSKKIRRNDSFDFAGKLKLTIEDDDKGDGTRLVRLEHPGELYALLGEIAHMPIPPYLKREEDHALDPIRYQTVYAQNTGSVAAPTAGFHFDEAMIERLKGKGVQICFVTLHVGLGTFLPMRCEEIDAHRMHGESYEIPSATAEALRQARREGRRITVVGTTAVRALESAATSDESVLKEGPGYTEIFIRPPYTFRLVDRLLTNFHQPRSTLIVLVSALAGREFILKAYGEAIQKGYRLFSYGDCMLLE